MASPKPIFVAAAIFLAGCSQEAPAVAAVPLVEPEPGFVIRADHGALAGVVLNEASLPLRNAQISVIGTELFAIANETGHFRLLNLTPQSYQVRIWAETFAENLTAVNVTAGNVTHLRVVLLPASAPGFTPHTHDYWGGQDTYTLLDADRTFDAGPRDTNLNNTPYTNSPFLIDLGNGASGSPPIVLPGTKEILVKLTFTTTQTTLEKLGIQYWPPDATIAYQPITVGPAPSGTVLRIPVSPTGADSGHSRVSQWMFYLCPCNDVRAAPNYRPGAIIGPIHIEMTLVRGHVPLEPEHPDFWKGRERLVLRESGTYHAPGIYNVNERDPVASCLYLPQGVLVPPGTERMRLDLWWRYDTANGTQLDRTYGLTFRTADQSSRATDLAEYRRHPPVHRGDHHVVYDFEVPAEQTDAFYAKRSGWCFMPGEPGKENDERSTDAGRGLEFDFRVEVFRTP